MVTCIKECMIILCWTYLHHLSKYSSLETWYVIIFRSRLFLHTLQKDDGYFVVAGLFFILSIFEIDFIRDYGIQKGFYGWISLWPVYVKLKLILVERTFFYINRSMVLHPVRFFKNLGLPPPPDFYVRN